MCLLQENLKSVSIMVNNPYFYYLLPLLAFFNTGFYKTKTQNFVVACLYIFVSHHTKLLLNMLN